MQKKQSIPLKQKVLQSKRGFEKINSKYYNSLFISLASHQLRTPLTDISLGAEMLIKGFAGQLTKDQKKYLNNIYSEAKEMISLIESLLNVSRIEMGVLTASPEPTNLYSFTEKILKEFQMQVKKKGIRLKKTWDKNIPLMNLDQRLLSLVIDNLVSNAVKYTGEKGTILIVIKKQEKNIIFKIADTGPGIPEELRGQVFKILKNNPRGTGLGLYIAKTAANKIGAKLWFESVPKKGTAFYLSLKR